MTTPDHPRSSGGEGARVEITHKCHGDPETCFCMYDPECNPNLDPRYRIVPEPAPSEPAPPANPGGEGQVWMTCTVWDCPRCEGLSFDRCEHEVPHGGYWKELIDYDAVELARSEASRLREERDAARKALDELERVSTPLPDADYLPSHECPMCPDSGPENPCLDPDHLSHQATYWRTVSEEWRTRAERAEAERDELGVDLDDALIALRAIFRILNDPDIPDPTARTRAKLKTRPFLASLNQTEGGE